MTDIPVMIARKASIQKSLAAIGVKNGSAPPESGSNTFGIAYEFFVADQLRSACTKRYDAAKAAALSAGVLGDEKDYREGDTVTAFDNEHLSISVKKASGSYTLDKTQLRNELSKAGLTEMKINGIMDNASKPKKGAVSFITSIKV